MTIAAFLALFAGMPMQTEDPIRRPFPETRAPEWTPPKTAEEWPARRAGTRSVLEKLLGDLPPRPEAPAAKVLSGEDREGYRLEKIVLDNGAGAAIPSWMLTPKGTGPFPTILWLHWHGGEYHLGKEQIWQEAPGGGGKIAELLVRKGYVVFAPDAYGFGERQGLGPDGPAKKGGQEEASLAKAFLWMGRTLWGMMVRDDRIALDYLSKRPEVIPSRIGATGISMGSTRSWWLGALDDRVAAAVAVCCLTRYEDLLREKALWAHGIYYFVPGLLRHFDTEAVTALLAPRPFLTLSGATDIGSPAAGVERINASCAAVWSLLGRPDAFRGVLYPGVGHVYTPEMWREMTAWMDRFLK
jgi:dienelactone hydrolase